MLSALKQKFVATERCF